MAGSMMEQYLDAKAQADAEAERKKKAKKTAAQKAVEDLGDGIDQPASVNGSY